MAKGITNVPESFWDFTVSELLLMGVLKDTDIAKLNKKHVRLNAKRNKDLRQFDVNKVVDAALAEITPGQLFKHRAVWEAVGREDFTRDEVLQSLRVSLENGVLTKVKLSDNNFQIFWCVGDHVPVATPAAEEEVPAAAK